MTEAMITTKFLPELSSRTEGAAQPLDEVMMGGLALKASITVEQLRNLEDRLVGAFAVMRADTSDQYGTCLAYGFGLSIGDEKQVDEQLIAVAGAQNHGMISRQLYIEGNSLWSGKADNKVFYLRKHTGPILLNNGQMPLGLSYGLHGFSLTAG